MSTDLLLRPAKELVSEIRASRLSAVDLLETCQRCVEEVEPELNALAVQRWAAAHTDAERADQAQRDGENLGPLHGLPVSVKEMFDVKDLPTTAGIKSRSSQRATRDAEVVRRLRAAGAIVIGKGNVPQLGMMAETDNPVYGRTNNPWNLDRSPGGSSGGEAALIAAGAVPLGLGSDGAGSIRQPSHACGICGFKPTGGRLPLQGHWLAANWPSDWAQPGPMARHVNDLTLAFSVLSGRWQGPRIYGEVPADPREIPPEQLQGLRVGVYEQLDEIPANRAAIRAVREAADGLRKSDIEVVPFQPDRVAEMWDLFMQIFYAEGLRDMQRQLRGSPVDRRVQRFFQLTQIPSSLRRPIAWTIDLWGQRHMAHTIRNLRRGVISAETYCQLLSRVQALRVNFGRRLQRDRIDLVLGPASPVPAFPHGEFYANYALIYTGIYNLLGLPAGVVAATRVRPDEVVNGPQPRDLVDRALFRCQSDAAGLPVGVQVIGPWWSDDRVLAAMQILERHLCTTPDYPARPPMIRPN